ncbi:hypothetical protein [Lysobacter sp.]|uniref:hypothetical protein n=1 Tax=Lysobacter sp. TaxID=72226 RepID=UPI002D423CD6|nr:hypothetical protein [Lysobacter sp.]HZX77148.1 hypothetical protein [Lysobacter sp.]
MKSLKNALVTVAFGVLVSAAGAVAANCPAGFYCVDLYNDCMSSGQHLEAYCRAIRDDCIADACYM